MSASAEPPASGPSPHGPSGSGGRRAAFLVPGVLVLAALACRGEPRGRLGSERLDALVDSLRPAVESAAGLPFTGPVRSAVTTRDAVRAFLIAKLEEDFPPERMEGLQAAYALLGLLPDTLDLHNLLLDLYTEQVAGYYDPERSTLYAVEGADPVQLRLIMAHELVHALQHQYLPLDSLMVVRENADRLAATQAVLEGHATVASIRVLTPGRDLLAEPGFWEGYREQLRAQQERMEVFRRAPLVLREGLVFPYLAGALFMRWWEEHRQDPLPGTEELPTSTEQVLHPSRYAAGDAPLRLRFAATDTALYEDTIGELEVAILLALFRGADAAAFDVPLGWAGDRYRVVRTPDGPALVWYVAWDGEPYADRFLRAAEPGFAGRAHPGYRVRVERADLADRPAVRITHAPVSWSGWNSPPKLEIMP